MEHSVYRVKNKELAGKHIALICDLHRCDPTDAIEILRAAEPDIIVAPGDIFELLDGSCDEENENGFRLLGEAARIAPTFYSGGNHEIGGTRSWTLKWKFKSCDGAACSEENLLRIRETGAHIVNDSYEVFEGIAIGGVSSGITRPKNAPKLDWIENFYREPYPKILLCHHPEYYGRYVDGARVDLIASGHAHGGQWRFFGRGVFAPGQGIFPKYTSGIYDGKLAVSRGMKRARRIPRFFNKTEVLSVIFE